MIFEDDGIVQIPVHIEPLNEYVNLNCRRHGEAKQISLLIWIKNNLLALATWILEPHEKFDGKAVFDHHGRHHIDIDHMLVG